MRRSFDLLRVAGPPPVSVMTGDGIDFSNVVLLLHPGDEAGETTFYDSSSYGRSVNVIGTVTLVDDADAPGGTAIHVADGASRLQIPRISADNARAGAFMIDVGWKSLAANTSTGFEHCIFNLTESYNGRQYEWAVAACREWIAFYYGNRGNNQAVIRFFYPDGMDQNTVFNQRLRLRVGRDADGNWGAWLEGVRCTQYQVAPLGVTLNFGGVTTGTYNNAIDLGDNDIPYLYVGNVFVDVGGNVPRHIDSLRYTVGQCCDVFSDYDPWADLFPSPTVPFGTTWNPDDKSSGVTLTAAFKTASKGVNTGGDKAVRTRSAKSAGKWCLPIKITRLTGAAIDLGLAAASASLSTYVGGGSDSWGYDSHDGELYHGGGFASTVYGETYVTGDVVEILYDADTGELRFTKNGVVQAGGVAAVTGLTGPLFGTASINVFEDVVTLIKTRSAYAIDNGYALWS